MRLIGSWCKCSDVFSLRILIGRGLFLLFLFSFDFISLLHFFIQFARVGVYGAEVTPVPFPNTEVKLCCDDDTWLATARENISMPAQQKTLPFGRVFCLYIN